MAASYGDPVDPQNVSADTIFVQVAAFRDPEYLPTLHSLFSRAANPERIRVGACLQYDWDQDTDCFALGYPQGLLVEEQRCQAIESGGVGWARHRTQKLYGGEKFTLQIDSHMRFVPGWDTLLIEMWRSLRNNRAVITHYPPNYEPGRGRERRRFAGLGARTWKKGTLWFSHSPEYLVADPPRKPAVGAFVAAGMLFGPGRIITDVPYDPWIERHGEESALGVRLWTHGYDIYYPNKVLMWHRAVPGSRPMDHEVIVDYQARARLSALRTQVLLSGLQCADETVVSDLELYSLGNKRTLEEYQEWSGVNFAEQTFSKGAEEGIFKPFKHK